MKKIRLSKKKLLALLVMLTVVTLVITVFILAKYTGEVKVEGNAELQSFDVNLHVASESSEIDEDGVVMLTPEQYEKFKLEVEKTGDGWAYIRVLVKESWIYTDSDSIETVLITTGGVLQYNDTVGGLDTNNNYFYVNGIVKESQSITIINSSGSTVNSLPTDIPSSSLADYKVKLSIKVEAIQYNRRKALWGF